MAAELGPGAGGALVEPQLRAAVVPEVDAEVGVLAAVLRAHGRADPLAARSWVEVTSIGEDWSLPYVSAVRMSPAVALVPTTACEEIEIAAVAHRGPVRPERAVGAIEVVAARRCRVSVQVTATLVTLAAAIVPVPLVTVQVWPVGVVLTVTL